MCSTKPNYDHNALADLLKERDQLKADSEVVADLVESRLAENLRLKEENERLRRVTHVSLPTSTMEYEFSNYHRRGFNAGIRQGEAERDQLKAELDRLRDVQILLNTERALVEQLEERMAEARELLRYSADECIPSLGREIEDWLEANKP